MKRLNIAMLSAQEQIEEMEVQSELDVVGQQAEDAIAEAVEVQADIEQTQQATADAEEVVQQVEEERQVLELAQAQGGAEQAAMESLQRAMKRFEKRTGVPSSITSMGMESFGSKTTRVQATKIAMEGAVEYIKKLIKMLTDAVLAVWEKVKAFFKKIFGAAERLAKRAKQLEEAAKAAQGKTAKSDAVVTTSSVLQFARVDGKAVEGSEFLKQYINQNSSDTGVSVKAMSEMMSGFHKNDINIKMLSDMKTGNKEGIVKGVVNAFAAADTSLWENGKVEEGFILHTPKEPAFLLGDYGFSEIYTADSTLKWEQLSANYGKLSKGGIARSSKYKEDSVKSVKPLSPEDAKKLAYQVAGRMNSMVQSEKEVKKLEAIIKDIVAKANEASKGKDVDSDVARVVTGIVRGQTQGVLKTITDSRSYDVRLCKAALDYVAASVNLATGKGAASTGKELAVV